MSRNAQGAFSASKLHRSCSHACAASAHKWSGRGSHCEATLATLDLTGGGFSSCFRSQRDSTGMSNARRACARGLQYSVCLSVTNFLLSFHVYTTNYTSLPVLR